MALFIVSIMLINGEVSGKSLPPAAKMKYDAGKELFNLAIQDYNSAIELNPNNFKAYMARSIIYLNIGQNTLALEDANKAVALNPKNPDVYNNLKQYDSALKDYSKALELDPKNFSAYKGRGSVYFSLQQYERAIEELNKAIEIYPELNAVNLRRHCDYLSRQ